MNFAPARRATRNTSIATFAPAPALAMALAIALALASAALAVAQSAYASDDAQSAAATRVYKGKATSLAGDFKYGKVVAKVKGSKLTHLKVEAVTSACYSGTILRTHVYNANDKTMKVLEGSNRVKSGKLHLIFQPDPTVEDMITLDLKVSSSKVTGTSTEEGVCAGAAKLKATR